MTAGHHHRSSLILHFISITSTSQLLLPLGYFATVVALAASSLEKKLKKYKKNPTVFYVQ
jgi:hypothetical protein